MGTDERGKEIRLLLFGQPRKTVALLPAFSFRALHVPTLLALVAVAAGCGEHIIPVLRPIPTERVKPGEPNQALVVLPNGGVASVHLHYVHIGGRVWVSNIAIVNHYPDRVQLIPTKTRVYVDSGKPLQILAYREIDGAKGPLDRQVLSKAPEGATGKWLLARPRFVTRDTIRGPTVVLFYTVQGFDGFVKLPYEAMWDLRERSHTE